mgnify:CR=1 FL=1
MMPGQRILQNIMRRQEKGRQSITVIQNSYNSVNNVYGIVFERLFIKEMVISWKQDIFQWII